MKPEQPDLALRPASPELATTRNQTRHFTGPWEKKNEF